MKWQTVTVEFPKIEFKVGGEQKLSLETWCKPTATVKVLREAVENYAEKFIDDVVNETRGIFRGHDRDTHEVTLPSIELLVAGERVFYMSSVVIEADRSLDKWQLPRTVGQNVPNATANICAYAIADAGVVVVLEDDEVTIECPMRRNNASWGWNMILSETMVTYEQGKEVKVKYGSFLHNALWRLSNKEDRFAPSLEEQRTFTTLQRLGLIDEKQITALGNQVLEELEEIDPSEVHSLVSPFAGVLLGALQGKVPMVTFARNMKFIKFNDHINPAILANGKEWLIDNCLTIVNSSSCSDSRKQLLVEYMPLSHLPIFLAHPNEKIRREARQRADMLEA